MIITYDIMICNKSVVVLTPLYLLMMKEKYKRVKTILPLLILSIILPTADVGTDLALIIKIFSEYKSGCRASSQMNAQKNAYLECVDVGADQLDNN